MHIFGIIEYVHVHSSSCKEGWACFVFTNKVYMLDSNFVIQFIIDYLILFNLLFGCWTNLKLLQKFHTKNYCRMHIKKKKELVVCDFFSLHFEIQNGFFCQPMASLASFAFVSSTFLGLPICLSKNTFNAFQHFHRC
jgi:hypothetical protein